MQFRSVGFRSLCPPRPPALLAVETLYHAYMVIVALQINQPIGLAALNPGTWVDRLQELGDDMGRRKVDPSIVCEKSM